MPKNLPKKILITGASGMLGLNLCRMLRQERYEVVGAYNSNPELLNVDVEKLQLDITSKEMVMKVAKKHPIIDVIIHCAAMTNPDQCEKDKKLCSLVNVVGTKNIVDLAKNLGAKLIFISTPMVFSGNEGNYNEKSIPEPLNYYAKTKLEGEKEVLKYDKGLVVRVNPIGLRASGAYPSFIQWFVEAARTNKSFTLFKDVRINPISTHSFSQLVPRLVTNFIPGILHIGSSDTVQKSEIWELILSRFPNFSGKVREVSVDESDNLLAKRPKEMWLNVEKGLDMGIRMPFWKEEVQKVVRDLGVE